MHTGYDVTLLDGAASGHCTGELAAGDANYDHRAQAKGEYKQVAWMKHLLGAG
ncbi:MAG TPA: hypothetical protein VHK27_01710 [Gammaproteobacteria bacterium]|nr:hypothetical protein [Gammaproteobacteria bacterium]